MVGAVREGEGPTGVVAMLTTRTFQVEGVQIRRENIKSLFKTELDEVPCC